MPWHKVKGHSACPDGQWAVVKDSDGEVEGCHASEKAADKQLAALYASENKASLRFAGPAILEGEENPSGDGRAMEHGALYWDDVLPIALVWDREEGDHSAMTVGFVDTMERHENGVIWVEGSLSDTGDPETAEAINRVSELLGEGAVGVSLRWDSVEAEVRVKKSVIQSQIDEFEKMMAMDSPPSIEDMEHSANGDRIIVAKFSVDDALEVTTRARPRHLAIVDTAAWVEAKISLIATGSIAAAGIVGDWAGREHWFGSPKFGDYSVDSRVLYDPDRGVWSCPPTLVQDGPEAGRVYGHITPMGICLRGRPDRCVTPPDGDLEGFMRGRAPAAGGLRTGVICCGGDSSHCDVGIGAARATEHYDKVGRAVADVRVGRDQYGIWFAGMARPGASEDDLYAFAASDVSGHWEYTPTGRMTLVGLPAVNVGGFPKGYMTYEEFRGGLAAAAGITVEDGCGSWTSAGDVPANSTVDERLERIELAVGEMYAAHLRNMEDHNAR